VIVPFPSGAIKDFIAQIRQQDRENLVKEIEEKQVELSDKGEDYRRLLGLQEAIEIIKK